MRIGGKKEPFPRRRAVAGDAKGSFFVLYGQTKTFLIARIAGRIVFRASVAAVCVCARCSSFACCFRCIAHHGVLQVLCEGNGRVGNKSMKR